MASSCRIAVATCSSTTRALKALVFAPWLRATASSLRSYQAPKGPRLHPCENSPRLLSSPKLRSLPRTSHLRCRGRARSPTSMKGLFPCQDLWPRHVIVLAACLCADCTRAGPCMSAPSVTFVLRLSPFTGPAMHAQRRHCSHLGMALIHAYPRHLFPPTSGARPSQRTALHEA